MGDPVFRISRRRKDEQEITFKNYKGEEKTHKFQPIAAIFRNDDGKFSIKFEAAFAATLGAEEHWINFNENTFAKDARPAGKPRAAKKAKQEDSDDDF